MNFSRFNYIFAAIFLSVLYFVNLPSSGYRLPFYFMPDGEIFPSSSYTVPFLSEKISKIDGQEIFRSSSGFKEKRTVSIVTNGGHYSVQTVPSTLWDSFLDFKYLIVTSFIFLFSAFWFLDSGNDIHLAVFNIVCAILPFSLVVLLSTHQFSLLWVLTFFLLPPALFNLGLRTTGREIPGILLLVELLVQIILSFVAYVGADYFQTFKNLKILMSITLPVTIVLILILQIEIVFRKSEDPIEKRKRWVLCLGILFGLFLPSILFFHRSVIVHQEHLQSILFGLFLFFPFSLLYGTYRINLVPFQLIFTRSILAGLLTGILVSLYGLVLILYYFLLPEKKQGVIWIGHLILILAIVFFLDPLRRKLGLALQKKIFRLNKELTESLEDIARLLINPLHLQSSIETFLEKIQATLGIEKAEFLINESAFPDMKIKSDYFRRLDNDSSHWRYLHPEKVVVTSYLTYSGGKKGKLYRYLSNNRYYLAVGISGPKQRWPFDRKSVTATKALKMKDSAHWTKSFRSVLLLGHKEAHFIFRLSEIRYLQEAVRLLEMLIQNYILLVQEVEKRRRMRELFLAGQMQKNISPPDDFNFNGMKYSIYSHPLVTVTGDHIDIIKLPHKKLAFFLGDVSGHGLGTGYLVSTFRSLIRSHLESGESLRKTIQIMNQFLMERYKGAEYITLFGFLLDIETKRMEYLNAAHPGPFIKRKGSRDIIQITNSQRILGVLSSEYQSDFIDLQPGDRMFLYSDGVTETFDDKERTFGEDRLRNFIQKNGDMPLEKIKGRLKNTLEEFRGKNVIEDDVTFVTIEFFTDEQ